MLGTIIGTWLLSSFSMVIGIAFGLAALSILDDKHHLPILIRLGVHFLASLTIIWETGPMMNVMIDSIAVLALVWFINLYNFMDGADGLAGGMAVIGFSAYAIAAFAGGNNHLAAFCLCVVASSAMFLIFNFPPARIFMGDVGSVPLGFLAGSLGWIGWQEGAWPWYFPLVVFAPFFVDATLTLARRALQGKRIWHSHREHYYQRLVLSGWTHRRLAISEYLLMIFCAACGVVLVFLPLTGRVYVIAMLGGGLAGLMYLIDRRWKLFSGSSHA